MTKSIIKEKSFAFALRIIVLTRWLRQKKEYELGSQILRSGTSIGSIVDRKDQPGNLSYSLALTCD